MNITINAIKFTIGTVVINISNNHTKYVVEVMGSRSAPRLSSSIFKRKYKQNADINGDTAKSVNNNRSNKII